MRMRCLLNSAAALLLAGLVAQPGAEASEAPLNPDRLLTVQGAHAFALIDRLAEVGAAGDNIVVSPASTAAVLALLDLGADAELRRAIHAALGFPAEDRGQPASDLARLRATVSALDGQDGPLTLANAIVFDPQAAPEPAILAQVRATGAEASVEDLASEEALQRINDWVSQRTEGLIPTILEEPPREPGLVALNALHFKDEWRLPFDPGATVDRPFHLVSGGSVEVPMMRHLDGTFRFRRNERFVAVDLPYATDGFALTVVTSRQEPRDAAGLAEAAAWLDGSGFTQAPGEVAMPRFSLTQSAELLGPLDALGLYPARASLTALSGFSPSQQMISRIVQRTVLQIDEAGTEAAAATAVTTMRSMPVDFVKMTVNKPFLFALRDHQTGLILLAGYVANPVPEARLAEAEPDRATRGVPVSRQNEADAAGEPHLHFELEIQFGFDSAEISNEARDQLSELAATLKEAADSGARFEIAGHTDKMGDAGYNKLLSKRRAEAVKAFLVARLDIDSGLVTAIGHGEEQLKNTDDPFAAENRRVEVTTVAADRQAGR